MTATSAMNPGAVLQRPWTGALRMAIVAFVVVVLALGAFAFGRSSASTSHPSPAISHAASTQAINPTAVNGAISIDSNGAPHRFSTSEPETAPVPEQCQVARPC